MVSSKPVHSGTILLIGAKLPEVFKDTDADFNLGFAIGAAKGSNFIPNMHFIIIFIALRNSNDSIVVRICFHGELFDPENVTRTENGDFVYSV